MQRQTCMNLSNGDKQVTSEQKHIIYSCSSAWCGAMNEFWLVAPRMHCNMLYICHHCWDLCMTLLRLSWCRVWCS